MDFTQWLACPPYSWSQAEKEQHYLPLLKELTEFHRLNCPPYGKALNRLGYIPDQAAVLEDIPMMPISLFKYGQWRSIPEKAIAKILTSSGTSGQSVSQIVLDNETATNQQLVLAAILQDFIGSSRLPMLIIDIPSILKNNAIFSARAAAIRGFSMIARHKCYALDDDGHPNIDGIRQFISACQGKPFLIFGFTFMIWKYFYQALKKCRVSLDCSNAIVLHGGGWKRMQDQAVTPAVYKQSLKNQFGITRVHNYYGMTEQTGCIYMECEYGHLHASLFSDIRIRHHRDFSLCSRGESGIIQVLSPLAASYPGHSLLTEDMGTLSGTDDCPCGRKGNYFSVDGRIPAAEIRGCSDTHD